MFLKHSLQKRLGDENDRPARGISIQDWPIVMASSQREHLQSLPAVARLGLPLLLPIRDGVGPLGLSFVIIRLYLSNLTSKFLKNCVPFIKH